MRLTSIVVCLLFALAVIQSLEVQALEKRFDRSRIETAARLDRIEQRAEEGYAKAGEAMREARERRR